MKHGPIALADSELLQSHLCQKLSYMIR